ncbi:MAG: hypothetical protein AB7E79_14745 [Rhodospirillaceae bacterium]
MPALTKQNLIGGFLAIALVAAFSHITALRADLAAASEKIIALNEKIEALSTSADRSSVSEPCSLPAANFEAKREG